MKSLTSLLLFCLFLILFILIGHNCINSKDSIASIQPKAISPLLKDTIIFDEPKKTYYISERINLNGKRLIVPSECRLVFNGGCISNGTICGKNTYLTGKNKIFDNVNISGTWRADSISTRMFSSLKNDNDIQNVIALASPDINNVIIIEKGDYWVHVGPQSVTPLIIPSNTVLHLEGKIHMRPNNNKFYSIISIENSSNVSIIGDGGLIGDRYSHTGIQGEWGHCLHILNSNNVTINRILIRDAWGDCIYIGSKSDSVLIDDCVIKGGRRQGISITSGSNIMIRHCTISDVKGTSPEFGIDVEPNKGDSIKNILICKSKISNCYGGISCSGKAEKSYIDIVKIDSCTLSNCQSKFLVGMGRANNVTISNCVINSNNKIALWSKKVNNCFFQNNRIVSSNKKPIQIIQCDKIKKENNTILNE